MAQRPSLVEYIRTVAVDWLKGMEGAAGVFITLVSPFIPNQFVGFLLLLVGFSWFIATTYRVWSAERRNVICLSKISRTDLQRMLGGMFIGKNDFMYGGDINLCKRYDAAFEIARLNEDFDLISVRAPANSIARIALKFSNGHSSSQNIAFYVRDGRGAERRIEDIYDTIQVLLDSRGEFGLKVVRGEGYQLHEMASLWVDLEGFSIA